MSDIEKRALDILRTIVLNARVIPDPNMSGATDCYAVPLDDIEAARAIAQPVSVSEGAAP